MENINKQTYAADYWSAVYQYYVNDRVMFDNIEWICQRDNYGVFPGSDCDELVEKRAWIKA